MVLLSRIAKALSVKVQETLPSSAKGEQQAASTETDNNNLPSQQLSMAVESPQQRKLTGMSHFQRRASHSANGSEAKLNSSEEGKKEIGTFQSYIPKKQNASLYHTTNRPDCGDDAFFVMSSYDFPSTVSSPISPPPSPSSYFSKLFKSSSTSSLPLAEEMRKRRVCALGVADGVGAYSLKGVDASEISWALMNGVKRIMKSDPNSLITGLQALSMAYNEIVEKNTVKLGACTACVASIESYSSGGYSPRKSVERFELSVTNLGDSACMVIRNGQMIFRTKEQTHAFNMPYQLTVPRNRGLDTPEKAQVYESVELLVGDVVILATDGLTDNLYDCDIITIVKNNLQQQQPNRQNEIAKQISKELSATAYAHSISSENSKVPFVQYALQNNKI